MQERLFESAHAMMRAALEEGAAGTLVLTPTSRLAKRYRHARRMEAVRGGRPASWETPPILGFARWVRSQYEALWEPRALLPKAGQLRLWAQAFEELPPPAEFEAGIRPAPALYARLQQTYDLLCRKGAERSGRDEGIARWRGPLVQRFEALVRERGYRCWDEAVRTVKRALESGALPRLGRVVVILHEEPEALESELFASLEALGTTISIWRLAAAGEAFPCRVYATPEQECRAACHEARLAWNSSRGGEVLGIVALDPAYFPLLSRSLEELSGRAVTAEGEGRFNIAWGVSLTGHPLFQAAVIPLRIGQSDAPAPLLSSLLSSPYSSPALHGISAAGLREALWPEERELSVSEALDALAKHGRGGKGVAAGLRPFARADEKPLGQWLSELRAAWKALGFPFLGTEVSEAVRDAQANAWEGLERSLDELARLAGDRVLSASEALQWLSAVSENRQVVAPGAESGGLQVLSATEAFGLPFDRLWVVGCHGAVLPAPRPAEPLLTPEEVRQLEGSPAERSWQRALQTRAALGALTGGTPPTFSRALAAPDGSPFLASPLLHEAPGGETLFDIWGERASAWGAAPWLGGALRGLARVPAAVPAAPEPVPDAAPKEIHVTELGQYLRCPFQFFAQRSLRLAPLPEPPEGLSPLARGTAVHKIVETFMRGLDEKVPAWPDDDGGAWAYLREVTDSVLAALPATAEWRAERRWLLGEDDEGALGVLRAWLEAERDHRREGWRPLPGGLEARFQGLKLEFAPVLLRGTIDRVDEHKELGRWVLDYKSGRVPGGTAVLKEKVEPQLLAYGAAVTRDLLRPEGERVPFEGPVVGGYIPLRHRASVTIVPLTYYKTPLNRQAVEAWEGDVVGDLAALAEGRFPAAPRPKGERTTRKNEPCLYCPMQALCGFFDDPERALAEGGEEAEP